MLTPILPTPLPGITAAALAALDFYFIPDFGGFYLCRFGDYQLCVEPQPTGPAVAGLILDEDVLFTTEVSDNAALVAVHARVGNEVAARQAKRYTSKYLFEGLVSGGSISGRVCPAAPEGTTP